MCMFADISLDGAPMSLMATGEHVAILEPTRNAPIFPRGMRNDVGSSCERHPRADPLVVIGASQRIIQPGTRRFQSTCFITLLILDAKDPPVRIVELLGPSLPPSVATGLECAARPSGTFCSRTLR